MGTRRCELGRQLDFASNAPGVVADDLVGRLRGGNGVVTLQDLLQREQVVAFVAELLRLAISLLAWQDGTGERSHVQGGDLLGERCLAREDRAEDRQRDVSVELRRVRGNADDDNLVFADLEGVELDILFALQLFDELDEFLVADHVHALDVAVRPGRGT